MSGGSTSNSEEDLKKAAAIEEAYEDEHMEGVPLSILVRGALLQCSCGTHCRRMNLPKSYGAYCKGDLSHPLVHDHNFQPGDDKNITYFGVCKSSKEPEGTEFVTLEPYVWPDGTKTSKEKVEGNRCVPCIIEKWFNPDNGQDIFDEDDNQHHAGLTMRSILVCKYGGVIVARESGQGYNEND